VLVRDALGGTSATSYDAAGRTVHTVDALGQATNFVYDSLGHLVQTLFSDGTSTSTTYDVIGQVSAQTDQAGVTTLYEHDARGLLTAVVDALGQRTAYTYDDRGNLIRQTDANSHMTRFEYDALGRRIVTVLPLGQRSLTTYDVVGNVASTTDFNGNTINYTYDTNNQVISKRFSDGTTTDLTYAAAGQPQTVVDARGTTTYAYDARNRLISRTDPDGRTVGYAYDLGGNETSIIIPSGTTSYGYDALNRLTNVIDSKGGVTRYTYDADGNLVRTDLPNDTAETRSYDSLNRLVFLENTGPGGVISSYRYTLDPTGRRSIVDEDTGRQVHYTYDALYRLTKEAIVDPVAGSRTISYTYDAVGNRLSRNDSVVGLTISQYDGNDRLVSETLGSQVTTYSYDANGNTLSRVTNAADQALYKWDFQNRLIGATVTEAAGTHRANYGYDANGIRVSQTIDGQQTKYLVDANRPFAQVLEEFAPGAAAAVSYVYGNQLISQNRGGVQSFYQVDALGSTRALTNAAGVVTDRYVYDAFGRIISQVGNSLNLYLFAGQQRDTVTGLDYLRARYLNSNTDSFLSKDPLAGELRMPLSLNHYLYALADPANQIDPSGQGVFEVVLILSIIGFVYGLYQHVTAKLNPTLYLDLDTLGLSDVKLQDGTSANTQTIADQILSIVQKEFKKAQIDVERGSGPRSKTVAYSGESMVIHVNGGVGTTWGQEFLGFAKPEVYAGNLADPEYNEKKTQDQLVSALANVTMHEAGHAFGLGHNPFDPRDIMFSGEGRAITKAEANNLFAEEHFSDKEIGQLQTNAKVLK
jgi:RHS repeat-associated protein